MVKNYRKKEKKVEKRNKIILGIFITVIMIGSTAGFFIGDTGNYDHSLEYEGADGKKYDFEQSQGYFFTEINEEIFRFYSHPLDVLSMNVTDESIDFIKSASVIYITFDPDSKSIQFIEQVRFELGPELAKKNKYLISGITKNSSVYNYEIITCENASNILPVVYFKDSNTTKGYVYENCIIFEGKRFDFFNYRDLIVYNLYGVI